MDRTRLLKIKMALHDGVLDDINAAIDSLLVGMLAANAISSDEYNEIDEHLNWRLMWEMDGEDPWTT